MLSGFPISIEIGKEMNVMDFKSTYTKGVEKANNDANSEGKLYKKIQNGRARKKQYENNWRPVDINEAIDRFAPGAQPYRKDGKIEYDSKDGRYNVLADIGGGYLRIYDTQIRHYVGLNGEDLRNCVDSAGKQHGRKTSEFNALTHFRIKKREGMK